MTELYKKHRPQTLDRIVGNETTVKSLQNMIDKKTLPHSILFSGPTGCGKTSIARILKDMLNCHDLDFKEINSSSFRGIDTIRDIQSVMNLAPAGGPVRVWLLDEFHKTSNDGQNAILKILEDTPRHVYFFLCTTDPEKLIKAVRNRCCDMPVRLLNEDELMGLLVRVCKREEIRTTENSRDALVQAAQGSARMLLVLLDKITNMPEGEQEAAIQTGLASEMETIDLCRALLRPGTPWKAVARLLGALKGEPESIRWAVLGYAKVVLLKEGSWQAYNVIRSFENNFYDSKEAGLTAACFEAVSQPQK